MPLPIITFFVMFFVLPIVGLLGYIFPGSLENVILPLGEDALMFMGPYIMALLENEALMDFVAKITNFLGTPFLWFVNML